MLASCERDAYDKGEGEYSLMTAEMVEAHVDGDKRVDRVETDDGLRLSVKNSFTTSWIHTADTTYRGLLYYNNIGEDKAEAVSLIRVGVLQPRDSIEGGLKTDPLYLESAWVGRNHKYLNLRLRLLTGSTDDENAIQTLGLLADTLLSTPSHVRLTLCHGQGGQPEYYSVNAYVSIPLSAFTADTLTLTVNTYGGSIQRTFTRQ